MVPRVRCLRYETLFLPFEITLSTTLPGFEIFERPSGPIYLLCIVPDSCNEADEETLIARFLQGKVLGGGSILNAMCWNRGGADDYDAWEALGNPGWGWGGILPYFIKVRDTRRFQV